MKPIIFSTSEAQALLNTKPGVWPAEPVDPSKPCKSQMRRVMKPPPEKDGRFWKWHTGMWGENATPIFAYGHGMYNRMPIKTGDILYVRETWQKGLTEDEERYYLYKADGEDRSDWKSSSGHSFSWKPSVHMPREAARLFLEIKSVRVEQLRKISPEDCVSEGAVKKPHYIKWGGEKCLAIHGRYKKEFAELWDAINAKRGYSWDTNPWVFVYEFMRVEEGNKR